MKIILALFFTLFILDAAAEIFEGSSEVAASENRILEQCEI